MGGGGLSTRRRGTIYSNKKELNSSGMTHAIFQFKFGVQQDILHPVDCSASSSWWALLNLVETSPDSIPLSIELWDKESLLVDSQLVGRAYIEFMCRACSMFVWGLYDGFGACPLGPLDLSRGRFLEPGPSFEVHI